MAYINRTLLNACNGCSAPKTIRKRLQRAGLSHAEAQELWPHVAAALAKQRERARNEWRRADRLLNAARTLECRLARYKLRKRIVRAPMFGDWRADFRERVLSCNGAGAAVREAQAAALEAICREARRRGWTIRHTSYGWDGRASSRYIVIHDIGEVRLSDHILPPRTDWLTGEDRRRSWDGEVIVGSDCLTVRKETWMRRLILAAAGHRTGYRRLVRKGVRADRKAVGAGPNWTGCSGIAEAPRPSATAAGTYHA